MSKVKVGYIREAEDTCDIIQRIILGIKRYFNIINIEEKEGKKIYYLPIYKNTNISKYRIKKLSDKLDILLEKDGVSNIAISKYLESVGNLKIYLYCKNINILDGRYLFKCLIFDCIKYVLNRKKEKMELRRSFIIN